MATFNASRSALHVNAWAWFASGAACGAARSTGAAAAVADVSSSDPHEVSATTTRSRPAAAIRPFARPSRTSLRTVGNSTRGCRSNTCSVDSLHGHRARTARRGDRRHRRARPGHARCRRPTGLGRRTDEGGPPPRRRPRRRGRRVGPQRRVVVQRSPLPLGAPGPGSEVLRRHRPRRGRPRPPVAFDAADRRRTGGRNAVVGPRPAARRGQATDSRRRVREGRGDARRVLPHPHVRERAASGRLLDPARRRRDRRSRRRRDVWSATACTP